MLKLDWLNAIFVWYFASSRSWYFIIQYSSSVTFHILQWYSTFVQCNGILQQSKRDSSLPTIWISITSALSKVNIVKCEIMIKTRTSVNDAKDWLDQLFLFPGLVWKTFFYLECGHWGGQSKAIFMWMRPFSAWWRTNNQTSNWMILVQACSWPVRRQSFAKSPRICAALQMHIVPCYDYSIRQIWWFFYSSTFLNILIVFSLIAWQ